MAGCPTIQLDGITGEVMECMRSAARAQGLPAPEEEQGVVSALGATAHWEWDEGAGTLSITFTQVPDWIGCGTIESRIRQIARSCGAP